MAASTITVTVTSTSIDQKTITVRGTLAWSASPDTYSTKGNVCSFAGLAGIDSSSVPLEVNVKSQQPAGSGAANLYVYNFNPGTTAANGQLQIFTGAAAQTALTELSAGAVPAGVSGDVIGFTAIFPRL